MPPPARAGLDNLYGAARVRGSDGSVSASGFYSTGGMGAWTRNGAGSYTCALSPGVGAANSNIQCGVDGIGASATNEIQWTLTDATHLDVRTFSGGVATDKNFWVSIRQVLA